MNLVKLQAKQKLLDEKIRLAKEKEQRKRERSILVMARKYGLLEMDLKVIEAVFQKISMATESRKNDLDTVAMDAGLDADSGR